MEKIYRIHARNNVTIYIYRLYPKVYYIPIIVYIHIIT